MSGKTLQCVDCGAEFTFSAKEQERFAAGGYTNEPECYLTCRQARGHDARVRHSAQRVTAIGDQKCTRQYALPSASRPEYRYSLGATSRFTVVYAAPNN